MDNGMSTSCRLDHNLSAVVCTQCRARLDEWNGRASMAAVIKDRSFQKKYRAHADACPVQSKFKKK